MVDAEFDCTAQDGAAGLRVPRRAVPVGLRKAHRAEPDAFDGKVAAETEEGLVMARYS
ncbi:hypothetical protein Aple_077510 [Acrocarpospora pleiomorpha]|uniref:Uncharacterized protein n=1 Tax=Acrocarpospora pleiomorpha TaxID=90975 RepID=A0A5M3XV55_9ACTN|nr:hypothetical protein [Acrocarpospora pleiomorpha]GES24852.1 hypothetical protein Aple_077510 [Acrocarpospora pleiomorpha]